MNRVLAITCLITLNLSLGFSQDFSFGVVSEKELTMDSYAKDPDADAVILFDKGKSRFKIDKEMGQLNIVFTRTRRIKVLKKSAQSRGDIKIYFYKSGYNAEQSVNEIRAISHNWDSNSGYSKSELSLDNVYTEQIGDELYVKKFVIPNVKIGSVIEYEYTLEVPRSNNIPDWEFQNDIPTLHSEYEVGLVPFYEYTYLLQGRNRFDKTEKNETRSTRTFARVEFQDVNYRFVMKNLDAFTDDSFITSKSDYITKIDWQLTKINNPGGSGQEFMTTWPSLSNELLAYDGYGKFIQKSAKSAKKIFKEELKFSTQEPLKKAQEILTYVKENYKWDGYYSKYTSLTPKNFMKEKEGGSAEINLFLAGLLQAADIDAKPVLLSTRNHGKIKKEYPFESFFNSSAVLIEIGQANYLLDATEPMLPFGWLPSAYINEQALIIAKDSDAWVELSTEPTSSVQDVMSINIDLETNLVNGTFKKYLTGYDALLLKKNPELIRDELNGYELDGEISSVGETELEKPLVITYDASVAGIDRYGDLINIRPFLNKPWGINPLKAKKRSYPVDFVYKRNREFVSTIAIPEGYKVLATPEPLQLNDNLVDVNFKIEQTGNIISVEGSYLFKKSVYQPTEYRKLREHIELIVDKFNELIVLKKAD